VRKAIAATKSFEGSRQVSFDENGDVDYDTMSGFKAVKADSPVGCKFQFETILECTTKSGPKIEGAPRFAGARRSAGGCGGPFRGPPRFT